MIKRLWKNCILSNIFHHLGYCRRFEDVKIRIFKRDYQRQSDILQQLIYLLLNAGEKFDL